MGDVGISIEEACESLTHDDIIVKGFNEDQWPLEEWWMNSIMP